VLENHTILGGKYQLFQKVGEYPLPTKIYTVQLKITLIFLLKNQYGASGIGLSPFFISQAKRSGPLKGPKKSRPPLEGKIFIVHPFN
jgi:hypothetical protein